MTLKRRGLLWASMATTSFTLIAAIIAGWTLIERRWGYAALFVLIGLCEAIGSASFAERLEVEKAKDSDEKLIEYLRTVIVDRPEKEDR
jgi:hypothetical protein